MGPLSGATTPGQSEPGSNDNEGILRIPQSSSITGTSPSDCLASYNQNTRWEAGSYPSTEMQSVYSAAATDLVIDIFFWYQPINLNFFYTIAVFNR